MVSLLAKSAAEGLLPVTAGALTLSEAAPEAITSVAPFRGQTEAVSQALDAAIGAKWPAPGQMTGKPGAQVAWCGLGQALVLGPPVSPSGAAVTDQTDAWAVFALEGAGGAEVVARLTPLDLRASQFRPGQAARSLLGHIHGLFLRSGPDRFELLVYRSMAATAVHEIEQAMHSRAAQLRLASR